MAPALEFADREVMYRGFRIQVSAAIRFGRVFVSASLTGGPDRMARQFGAESAERTVECGCAMTLHELRKVVDDLLEGRKPPVSLALRRAPFPATVSANDEGAPFDG